MKLKGAIIIFIGIFIAVSVNSYVIAREARELYDDSIASNAESIESLFSSFTDIQKRYRRWELFISLTVSHEDLTSIESDLAEILGACEADDLESAIIAKSRLENSLLHLARLSGLNIESLF